MLEVGGNVDTRLRKMEEGQVDGLVLAAAGLARLGVNPVHTETLAPDEMVPAPGQGALAVQARADAACREAVARLDHRPSRLAFEAERWLVRRLGGGCSLPLGALATTHDGRIDLVAVVVTPDGSRFSRAEATSDAPERVAGEVAELLAAQGAREILQENG
jgi:hydroxymethylbilane synthase